MQLQPDLAQAYASRGIARSNLGDEEGAIADLQTAARLFQQQRKPDLAQQVLRIIREISP